MKINPNSAQLSYTTLNNQMT